MKNVILKFSLLILTTIMLISCKKDREDNQPKAADSFLPMQVGNLWYTNSENFKEIKDSVMIGGKLYYKFFSLIGGDAYSIEYLRIDENGKLLASDPQYPTMRIQYADFNAKKGDQFFTTGQGKDIDQQVTVTEKTETMMSFSFDYIYHPNLKGHPYVRSYIKGQGYPGNWTRLRINGKQLK